MGDCMIWVKFNSLDAFNVWHETIKFQLGLPKISTDYLGNEVPDKTITTDYAKTIIVSDDDVRAFIEEDHAEGLEVSESPFVSNYGATLA